VRRYDFGSDRKTAKMDERDVQKEYQAPDNVPAGVAGEPAIPEKGQVMRWIGFDEMKGRRVSAQIGERICDFAEFSHSDVKLTESLRGLPTNVSIHVSLAQAKKLKATIDWVKDRDRAKQDAFDWRFGRGVIPQCHTRVCQARSYSRGSQGECRDTCQGGIPWETHW
jgi:hypothetical protein